MKLALAALTAMLLWQSDGFVTADPQHFQYQRTVAVAPGAGAAACAVVDGAVYAHTVALADLRLYAAGAEVPYALSTSQTAVTSDAAKVLNLGQSPQGQVAAHGATNLSFDLEMPARLYSSVTLNLAATNYIATAKVTGRQSLDDRGGTYLGSFTLFDLSAQHLGANTALPLSESSLPFLHVDLDVAQAPGTSAQAGFAPMMVTGAEVPPSRQAQTLYTTVATSTGWIQRGRETIASIAVPARVPIERVSFSLAAGDKTNFSREVRVSAPVAGSAYPESVAGTISRIRMTAAGKEIREESLSIPAVLGANGRDATTIEVAIENGDDRPLAVQSVSLEMRERKLCFDVPAQPVSMRYGDAKLVAPVYDYARIFDPSAPIRVATLGAEQRNPAYVAREEHLAVTEKHPGLIWLALLAVVAVLGIVAFRSAKKV